jgi:hypothetical protein
MEKLRLDCPNCGKAIAVSQTAKKARCPGCKEVVEVPRPDAEEEAAQSEAAGAAVAASDADANAGLDEAPPDLPDDEGDGDGAAGEDEMGEDATGGADDEGADDGEADPEAAPKARRAGERSSRRRKSKMIARAAMRTAGSQPLFVAGALGVVVTVGLSFFVVWPVAILIGVALLTFVDATMSRVTRMTPSAPGGAYTAMLWGLSGFLVVPTILYLIYRTRLIAGSAEDVGDPSMSAEDLEDAGKVAPPSFLSFGSVAVLAVAVVLGLMFPVTSSVQVVFGEPVDKKNPKLEQARFDASVNACDQGVPFFAMFKSVEPYEGIDDLVCKAYPNEEEKGGPTPGSRIDRGDEKRAFWSLQIEQAGWYRVAVERPGGSTVASATVQIRQIAP